MWTCGSVDLFMCICVEMWSCGCLGVWCVNVGLIGRLDATTSRERRGPRQCGQGSTGQRREYWAREKGPLCHCSSRSQVRH